VALNLPDDAALRRNATALAGSTPLPPTDVAPYDPAAPITPLPPAQLPPMFIPRRELIAAGATLTIQYQHLPDFWAVEVLTVAANTTANARLNRDNSGIPFGLIGGSSRILPAMSEGITIENTSAFTIDVNVTAVRGYSYYCKL
jgi:hypothetical protein